jgi:hypothetical protein
MVKIKRRRRINNIARGAPDPPAAGIAEVLEKTLDLPLQNNFRVIVVRGYG